MDRNDLTITRDILLEAGVDVPKRTIKSWGRYQREVVSEWAISYSMRKEGYSNIFQKPLPSVLVGFIDPKLQEEISESEQKSQKTRSRSLELSTLAD